MKTRNLLPRVYELKTFPGHPSPYVARWVVNGETRGKSFSNKTQAHSFRAALSTLAQLNIVRVLVDGVRIVYMPQTLRVLVS